MSPRRRIAAGVIALGLTAACSTGADDGGGVTTVPLVTVSAPAPPTSAGPVMEVVFEDHFDGDTLDRTRWGYESPFYGWTNEWVSMYDPTAVTVADGHLRVTAERLDVPLSLDDDGDGTIDRQVDWRSGFVTTAETFAFTTGRVEMRVRVPDGQGLWSAGWLRPRDRVYGQWPASGEIDVFEVLGDRPDDIHATAHWLGDDGHRQSSRHATVVPDADGFHTVTLDWTGSSLTWSVDGAVIHQLTDWETPVAGFPAPFDQPFHLNINLAVGGTWPGPPDRSTPSPAVLEVDWVRVLSPSADR